MYKTLEIERKDKVATIWMNRPEVFNAFNEELIEELARACAELDADAEVRVVEAARHHLSGELVAVTARPSHRIRIPVTAG